MIAPGMDYVYSLKNFVGVNISMIGGVYYAYVNFLKKQEKRYKVTENEDEESVPLKDLKSSSKE